MRSFVQLQTRDKPRQKAGHIYQLLQYIDIKILMEGRVKTETTTQQLLQTVDISDCKSEDNNSIILNRLLVKLQLHYNIPLDNREIAYYLEQAQVYVTCGIYPLGEDIRIDMEELDLNTKCLQIKTKNLDLMHISQLMYLQNMVNNIENEKEEPSDDQQSAVKGKKTCRRTKERRIGYIIEKVIEWRKYYSGTSDQARQTEKFSLEEAAKKVGISKKSLDDYLFQIRFGNRFHFNFNEHYNEKVGILRDFVRQQKKATKGSTKRKKKTKNQSDDDE